MVRIGRRQFKIGIMTKKKIKMVKDGIQMVRIGRRQLKIGIMTKKKMKVIGEPIAQLPIKAFFHGCVDDLFEWCDRASKEAMEEIDFYCGEDEIIGGCEDLEDMYMGYKSEDEVY